MEIIDMSMSLFERFVHIMNDKTSILIRINAEVLSSEYSYHNRSISLVKVF